MSGPSIVVNTGRIEPPPAALARLREVDPRLSMRFVPSVAGSYWVITRDWLPDDPRRAAIQAGQMDPAYANDIVATLPGEVGPQEAGAFVERFFVKSADPKADAVRRVAEQVAQQEKAQKEQLVEFINAQSEKAAEMTSHDRLLLAGAETAHPMVSGADFSAGAAGELPPAPTKRGRSSDKE